MREKFGQFRLYAAGHARKIASCILFGIVFVCSASFCSIDSGAVAQDTVDAGKVYLETDGGIVTIDRIDGEETAEEEVSEEDELSVSANDLVGLDDLSDVAKKTGSSNLEADEDTIIVDENGDYIPATYEDDWSLILINKKHLIPDDYEFEVASIKGAVRSDVRVVPYVKELIEAAADDGVQLYICSPYRDMDKQEQLFEKKVRFYKKQGYSDAESYDLASQTVAIPGTSEHQVGLAFDFIMPNFLMAHSRFVQRYEKPIINGDNKVLTNLNTRIRPFVMRRMKKEVLKELPNKIEEKMVTPLSEEQRKLYISYVGSIRSDLFGEIDNTGIEHNKMKILAALTRLRQICCHPSTFLEDYTGGSGKLDLLLQQLDIALANGHRTLVFSQFTTMLDIIRKELDIVFHTDKFRAF